MAKPSGRKRYARASSMRSRRRGAGGATWFRTSIAVVVLLGVMLVVVSRSKPSSASPGPGLQDHWHAALGVKVCSDAWKPNPPEFEKNARTGVYAGIHTHNDGLIHMEPQGVVDARANANLGRFFSHGGWRITATSLRLWDGTSVKNGDKCGKTKGTLQWFLNGKKQSGNPASHVFAKDGEKVVVIFGAPVKSVGDPPSASQLPRVGSQPAQNHSASTAAPADATATTVATPTSATTPTSAAGTSTSTP